MNRLRTILVDDEKNNLELLEYFIKKNCPSLEIVAKCSTYDSAKETIQNTDFDLCFLDILLDHDNSFHLLENLDKTSFHIIFTTAYDEFAIKAFRYNATDYLLKPIVIDDLIKAVHRVEEQIHKKEFIDQENIKQLSETILKKQPLNYLTVSGMNRVDFIQPDDIVYLKSAGRYTEFFLQDKKRKIISSRPIGEYETILPQDRFYRIHNSYLINLSALININKRAGNYCELTNGVSLPISRRRFEGLIKLMLLK